MGRGSSTLCGGLRRGARGIRGWLERRWATLRGWLRRQCRCLKRGWCRLFPRLTYRDEVRETSPRTEESEKVGFGEVISLTTVVLTAIGALIAYVQGKPDPGFALTLTYLVLSMIPILGLLFIVRSGKGGAHLFDRPSVWFAGTMAVLLFVIVPGIALACYYGFLPGQKVRDIELQAAAPRPHLFVEGSPDLGIAPSDRGIALDYAFCPASLGIGKLRGSLVLSVALDPAFSRSWRIAGIDGFRLEAKGSDKPEFAEADIDYDPPAASNSTTVYWHDLDVQGAYLLVVRLHSKSKDKAELERVISRIRDGHEKPLTVIVHTRQR